MKITIAATVRAPMESVWQAYVTPADIMAWNAASEDWHCPSAEVDLRVGGRFVARMEARDGSAGFDFGGTYTTIVRHRAIAYEMDDGRTAVIEFTAGPDGVTVGVTFDAESTHPVEMQRQGWQAILDRFARHVEAKG